MHPASSSPDRPHHHRPFGQLSEDDLELGLNSLTSLAGRLSDGEEFIQKIHMSGENLPKLRERSAEYFHNLTPRAKDDYEVHIKTAEKYKSRETASSNPSDLEADSEYSSWERWWVGSQLWKREIVLLLVLLIIFALIQLAAAIYYSIDRAILKVPDPYVCATPNCRMLDNWISQGRDDEVNPCEDFYSYVCGKYPESDTGNLWDSWFDNFARLESHDDAVLGGILKESSDPLDQRITKYYQTCMVRYQSKPGSIRRSLGKFMDAVFGGSYNMSQPTPLIETGKQMLRLVGDIGFFKTLPPISPPNILVGEFIYIGEMAAITADPLYLPIIFDKLGILDEGDRWKIEQTLEYMGGKISALTREGRPLPPGREDCEGMKVGLGKKLQLNFRKVFGAYVKEMDDASGRASEGDTWEGDIVPDPLEGQRRSANFDIFESCWNYWMGRWWEREKDEERKRFLVRATYATFWSLRLLIEVTHDINSITLEATEHEVVKNPFFAYFKKVYYDRRKESRCFQSMLDNMGYYPSFRYVARQGRESYGLRAQQLVEDVSEALLEQFRPMEEGGRPYLSSRYRQRIYRILGNVDSVKIMIPTTDDDPEAKAYLEEALSPQLEVGEDHIDNVIRWKYFTMRRTHKYWHSQQNAGPKGSLIWHRDFYDMEKVNVYAKPTSTPANPIIKIPITFFAPLYWGNDIMMANYTGARVLVAKAWTKLLQFDYSELNVEKEIVRKRGNAHAYHEGVVTDAFFKECNFLSYNWKYLGKGRGVADVHITHQIDPHYLAFGYGIGDPDHQRLATNALFQTSIGVKTMYHKYFADLAKEIKFYQNFRSKNDSRGDLLNRRLYGEEEFTEKQLFFMLSFRPVCRSSVDTPQYKGHVMENLAGYMQMREFADAWDCPPGSPMNPEHRCLD